MSQSLREIVTDSEFTGLSWSIGPDTPLDQRESAHIAAACAAKSRRDRELDRPRAVLYCPRTHTHLLVWPNGSIVWTSMLEIVANRYNVRFLDHV